MKELRGDSVDSEEISLTRLRMLAVLRGFAGRQRVWSTFKT